MARGINLLSSRFVATTKKEGRHADGGGLYLLVRKRSSEVERLWLFRYRRGGRGVVKEKALSLGTARDVTLAVARDLAAKCRVELAAGRDPRSVVEKKTDKKPTFGQMADQLIDNLASGFRGKKTLPAWKLTLGLVYCSSIRDRPVDEITTEDLLKILSPIWLTKPETAAKMRSRFERVFDMAKVLKHRQGENPAIWKANLKVLLPAQPALIRGHHKALPWRDMPWFMRALREHDTMSALALEWTVLTCARTSETIGLPKKGEIDRTTSVWTVPAERMKELREHRVPLTPRCLEIMDELREFAGPWLFPSAWNHRKHLSTAAMDGLLNRIVGDRATVHGFRSTFRDWVNDATSFPGDLAEAALAHLTGDEAERAYKRGDALERRRKMMLAWERYCLAVPAKVIDINSAKK